MNNPYGAASHFKNVRKGLYAPKNPQKYLGNANNIVYRSMLERRMMVFLDSNPNVLKWASEEIIIPYVHPLDGNIHRYFPDFFFKALQHDGKIKTFLVEVKPSKEKDEPIQTPKKINTRRFKRELITYKINSAKWNAAISFCKQQNWEFQVITEKELDRL